MTLSWRNKGTPCKQLKLEYIYTQLYYIISKTETQGITVTQPKQSQCNKKQLF